MKRNRTSYLLQQRWYVRDDKEGSRDEGYAVEMVMV